MQTRTLLLLSLVCGLAILFAGVALLVQIANRADVPPPSELGVEVSVGDMAVTVFGADERAGFHRVELSIGGVDDPDPTEGFVLIASGRDLLPSPDADLDRPCAPTTAATQRCEIAYDVSDIDGVARVLVYRRGDQSARWVLATP